MRIWKISSNIDNDEIASKNEEDEKVFEEGFKGEPMINSWSTIETYTSKEGIESDVVSWKGSTLQLILNKKAVDTLDDLIEGQVEILPLKHTSESYYAINVINLIDCIDYENSESNKWERIVKWAFIEEKVKNQYIFRAVQTKHSLGDFPIISVETFISDELKQRIESSGLKGFSISPVWASDPKEKREMFRASDVNPNFRVTAKNDFEKHVEKHIGSIANTFVSESNEISDIDLYHIAPNDQVPFNTVTTFGNSHFKMMTPATLDSGYAEVMMHLPKDWNIPQLVNDGVKGWPLHLLQEFENRIMRNGYWLGQWFVYPNQPTDDLHNTYGAMLGGGDYEPSYNMKPYSSSTDFCGVMVVPPLPQCKDVLRMTYLDEGKEVAGEWPIYSHTLLPLYREEIEHHFKHGLDSLLEKLMAKGIEAAFDLERNNTCK